MSEQATSSRKELNDRITPDLVRRMLGRALLQTRNEADAEDLVQDVLAKVYESPTVPLNGHFEGWLFTIMRNRRIDTWRKQQTRPTVNLDHPDFIDKVEVDSSAPITETDVDQFLQTLIASLRAGGKLSLARFVEAIAEVGWDKQLIAEKMSFSGIRSVDAYRSDLEKWCKVNGLRKEHFFGILAPIVLATSSGSASAATTTGTAAAAGTAKTMTWSFAASILLLAMFAGSGGDHRANAAAANMAQFGKFAPAGDAPGIGERPAPVQQKNGGGFRPAAVDIPGF